jgi:predicted O-methyltransferase YrrM
MLALHVGIQDVIDRCLRDGEATAPDGTLHTLFPVAIGAAEGESLREWVERERATKTVEVGLGYGISTLFIGAGLLANGDRDARHVAIDPHQETEFSNLGRTLLAEAGVWELVDFFPEESQIVLPRLLEERRRFDLAFVDGNHRFDGVFLDLVYLGRLVRPGGIVFVDDAQLRSVARAVSFFVTNLEWKIEEDASADDLHRWVVLRTPRTPPRRRFDHYVEF